MDNVILTPHVAFYSKTSLIKLKTNVTTYVVNALLGKKDYILANDLLKSGGHCFASSCKD